VENEINPEYRFFVDLEIKKAIHQVTKIDDDKFKNFKLKNNLVSFKHFD